MLGCKGGKFLCLFPLCGLMGLLGMSVKVKIDERGRVTIPTEVRESLGIGRNAELILEKRESELVLSKPLSADEFIEQAHSFMEDVKASKVAIVEPLRVKEIWKRKPEK
jgi:AbrB family looped-hinge helix DNA binding protein